MPAVMLNPRPGMMCIFPGPIRRRHLTILLILRRNIDACIIQKRRYPFFRNGRSRLDRMLIFLQRRPLCQRLVPVIAHLIDGKVNLDVFRSFFRQGKLPDTIKIRRHQPMFLMRRKQKIILYSARL